MGRAALTLFSSSSLINTIVSGPEKHIQVVSISYFVAVLCICIVVGHLLEKNRWVNESIIAILIGFISGTLILLMNKGTSSLILRFNEELFFIYLLPPIIFNAGFQVKKKQFFHNFLPIMLFGVVGVFISAAIISAGLKCSSAKHWPQAFAVVVGIVEKRRLKEKEMIILHSATTKMNILHLTCHQNVRLEVPGCSSAGYGYL